MNRYLFVLGLALLSIYPNSAAWGQADQLTSLRNQVRPHFKQARQYMGQLRRQGVNTSGWERQLNWVESQLNNMRWTGGTSGRGGTGFQTINPFGDYLFHGVPIRPQDGKLVTRQWDPNGLAARAEEWAKELRGLSKDINTRQGAERKQFVGELNERLTQLAAITNQQLQLADLSGGQQLKPQTGEDLSLAGLPRLQGDTPALLRDPFGRDDPTMAPAPDRLGGPDIGVNIDQPVPLLRSEPGPDSYGPQPWSWVTAVNGRDPFTRDEPPSNDLWSYLNEHPAPLVGGLIGIAIGRPEMGHLLGEAVDLGWELGGRESAAQLRQTFSGTVLNIAEAERSTNPDNVGFSSAWSYAQRMREQTHDDPTWVNAEHYEYAKATGPQNILLAPWYDVGKNFGLGGQGTSPPGFDQVFWGMLGGAASISNPGTVLRNNGDALRTAVDVYLGGNHPPAAGASGDYSINISNGPVRLNGGTPSGFGPW